jgi:hypothetical protein
MFLQRGKVAPFLEKDQPKRIFGVDMNRMADAAVLGPRAVDVRETGVAQRLELSVLRRDAAGDDNHDALSLGREANAFPRPAELTKVLENKRN